MESKLQIEMRKRAASQAGWAINFDGLKKDLLHAKCTGGLVEIPTTHITPLPRREW